MIKDCQQYLAKSCPAEFSRLGHSSILTTLSLKIGAHTADTIPKLACFDLRSPLGAPMHVGLVETRRVTDESDKGSAAYHSSSAFTSFRCEACELDASRIILR
jgi:hypothetical protein